MIPPEPQPEPPIPADLVARCAAIELLVADVDGVMTDGGIIVDDHGVETKRFHVRDGLGFSLWRRAGKASAILSGRKAEVVARRGAELKIPHVLQGIEDKGAAFRALLAEVGLDPSQACYVGDDLIDVPALALAGLAVCPADAVVEARACAHYATRGAGGTGVIREAVELILKAQGRWPEVCERFMPPP